MFPEGTAVTCAEWWPFALPRLGCRPWWHGVSWGLRFLPCFLRLQWCVLLPWEKWGERSFVASLREWQLNHSIQMWLPEFLLSLAKASARTHHVSTWWKGSHSCLSHVLLVSKGRALNLLFLSPGHKDSLWVPVVCLHSWAWPLKFTVIFYLFHIFSLLEFQSVYRAPFARNGLEALLFSICTGWVKAVPQQQPFFSSVTVKLNFGDSGLHF